MAPTRSLPLEISIPQTTVQSGGAMWRVPPFQAELHKTSALLITSLELEPARFRPSIDGSSIRTAFEAASDLAERLGGRLPSLAECQALFATGHHAEVDWELNTGVMEWTTTTPEWSGVPPLVHDAARQSGAPRQRIVANGELRASPNRDELAVRPLVDHLTGTSQFEVGLRVVRSTAPRLTPADFIVQGM